MGVVLRRSAGSWGPALERLPWPVGRLPSAMRDVDGGQLGVERGGVTEESLAKKGVCGIRSADSLQDRLHGLCWSGRNRSP